MAWKISPALAAGNSVILKPAEQSPHRAFASPSWRRGRHPEGVFNVLPGFGETGAVRRPPWTSSCWRSPVPPRSAYFALPGESNMKQVWLECGGSHQHRAGRRPTRCRGPTHRLRHLVQPGEVCTAGSRLIVETRSRTPSSRRSWRSASDDAGDPLTPRPRWAPWSTRSRPSASWASSTPAEGRRQARWRQGIRVDNAGSFIELTVFDGVDNKMKIVRRKFGRCRRSSVSRMPSRR